MQKAPCGILLASIQLLFILSPTAAADGVDAFKKWFDCYRRGRIDLYQQVETGCRTTAATGGRSTGIRYFRTDGVDHLERHLEQVAAEGGVRAARILLDAAVYVAHRDPAKEREKCVRQQPWLLRRRAAETLALLEGEEVREWLRQTPLHDRSALTGAARRVVAARTLGRMQDTASASQLVSMLGDELIEVRMAAARALGEMGDAKAIPALRSALDDPLAAVRLEALLAIDLLAGPAPAEDLAATRLEIALAALSDPAWSVRLVACEILRRQPDESAIPALVAALANEAPDREGSRRRVRAALRSTLGALTGEDFPSYRPEDWADWWDRNEDRFSLAEELKEIAPEQGARFFGIPVEADEVLFLLDVSGSMNQPVADDPDGPTRLFIALRETQRCLESLEAGTRFNIVLFNDHVLPFRSRPVTKSKSTVRDARAFLEGIEAEGGTNLFGALQFALGLDARKDARKAARDVLGREVDTIVLLTDGTPSRGAVLIPDEIVHQVSQSNRQLRIAIHTVAAGGSGRTFLDHLATTNYGVAETLCR